MMRVQEGDKAPVFSAMDHEGNEIDLGDYIGSTPLIIYFYPKNFTPGCTAEACSFRDRYQDFEDAGATVFGISGDSVKSHKRFSKKFRLPFKTLSDSNGAIRKMYGVKGELFGLLPGRETFVINAQGTITLRFNSMLANAHIKKALRALNSL